MASQKLFKMSEISDFINNPLTDLTFARMVVARILKEVSPVNAQMDSLCQLTDKIVKMLMNAKIQKYAHIQVSS